MTLAVEDANPKLVGVFADVDLQESVDNRLVKVDSLAIAKQHNCHSLGGDSFLQSASSQLFRQLLLQKKSNLGSVVLLAMFLLQARVSPVNFLNFENIKG